MYLFLTVQTVNLGSSFNVFEEVKPTEDTKEELLKTLKNGDAQYQSEEKICIKCGSFFVTEKINEMENKKYDEIIICLVKE